MKELISTKQLEEAQEKAKLMKEEIDSLWRDCDNNILDCDEASDMVDVLRDGSIKNLSMYLAVKNLDEEYNRKNESEQYDVTKIKISEEDEDKYKEYDKKLLSILNPEWTEEHISKEIGMLYLMSGFAVDKNLKAGEFRLEEGFIRKREEI